MKYGRLFSRAGIWEVNGALNALGPRGTSKIVYEIFWFFLILLVIFLFFVIFFVILWFFREMFTRTIATLAFYNTGPDYAKTATIIPHKRFITTHFPYYLKKPKVHDFFYKQLIF